MWRTPVKPSFACILLLLGVTCWDELRLSVTTDLASPFTFTITVQDDDRLIQWTGSDFRPRSNNLVASSPQVEVSTSGPDLKVSYRLERDGAVVSSGSVVLPRRSDWRWDVKVVAATTDPRQECFHCLGSRAFALEEAYRTPGRDSIWMVWSGNS